MLLGASQFWQLLCIGQHCAVKGLVWQKIQLGWMLGGYLTWPVNKKIGISHCHVATEDNEQLVKLERFGGSKNHPVAMNVNIYLNKPPGTMAQVNTSSEFRFATM